MVERVDLRATAAPNGDVQLLAIRADGRDFRGSAVPAPNVKVEVRAGGPPWLVVNHGFNHILQPWPVRLWRVRDVVRAPDDQQSGGFSTAASAFTVVDELPSWLVFGGLGWKVAVILERLQTLTDADVGALAHALHPAWSELYEGGWERFGQREPHGSCPVGNGLTEVLFAVHRAARRLDADVFRFDPDDGVEVLGDDDWVAGLHAAMAAALAYGAPGLFTETEHARLTSGWRATFDEPPLSPSVT